jgi:hypothetical protein
MLRNLLKRLKTTAHHALVPHEGNDFHPHLFGIQAVLSLAAILVVLYGTYIVVSTRLYSGDRLLGAVLPGILVSLSNEARAEVRAGNLIHDEILTRAAQKKAQDMAARGYFSHSDPDGSPPWIWLDREGYAYSYAGENLAINFGDSVDVMTAWKASPTHYANIIKPEFTHVGIGIATGMYQGTQTVFIVQFFAAPTITSHDGATSLAISNSVPDSTVPAVASATVSDVVAQPTRHELNMREGESTILGIEVHPEVVTAARAVDSATMPSERYAPLSFTERLLSFPRHIVVWFLSILLVLLTAIFVVGHVYAWRFPRFEALAGGLSVAITIGVMVWSLDSKLQLTHIPYDTQLAAVSIPASNGTTSSESHPQ